MNIAIRAGRPEAEKVARHYMREWRKARNLTQEQLADRLGENSDRTRISKLERGVDNLCEPTIYHIADALRIDPAQLFMDPQLTASSPREVTLIKNFRELNEEDAVSVLRLVESFAIAAAHKRS
jgi:transcriptional regulator with XRE-family HTH domain